MSNLESAYQAVQFIERHLKEPISVKDVADSIGYSLYHFSRTFNRATGHSPYDYIVRRRLSESTKDLIESDRRIIDIALEYQFNNPETYSRAFRRMFGLLPNQARKTQDTAYLAFRSPITLEYIRHVNKGDYLKPELVEHDVIHLIGMAAMVDDPSVITELWERFNAEVKSIPNRLTPERYYSVSVFPPSYDRRCFFHMASVEVDSLDVIPVVLVGKTIPALKYAKFIHKGPARDVGMTIEYIHQTWLPKSGNSVAAPFEIECYGDQYTGPDDPETESEILIPIRWRMRSEESLV